MKDKRGEMDTPIETVIRDYGKLFLDLMGRAPATFASLIARADGLPLNGRQAPKISLPHDPKKIRRALIALP